MKVFERDLDIHVSCYIIHNNKDMESAKMSINRWMDSEMWVQIHRRILFSYKENEIMENSGKYMKCENAIH